jgi:hypothetical protein
MVHQYLKRTAGPSRWADSSRSYHLQQVRKHLLCAAEQPAHARDWRPQLLVFTHASERRHALLTFSTWIEGGSGFTEAVEIVEGSGAAARRDRETAQRSLAAAIAQGNHAVFPLIVHAPDYAPAMDILIQSSGIGPLRPNTVVINWMGESARAITGIGAYNYVKQLMQIFRHGKNLVLLRSDGESWSRLESIPVDARRIDIWWQGDATSRLTLLLAYLMTRSQPWEKTQLRVLTMGDGSHVEIEKRHLTDILEEIRIDAVVHVVEDFAAETIVAQSTDAAFVFLPMRIQDNRILDPSGTSFERSLPRLPASAVVMAAEDIDLDATPEEGLAAQVARAVDDLEAARKKAMAAEKSAAEKKTVVDKLADHLDQLEDKGIDGAVPLAERKALKEKLKSAASGAEKAYRRAIKAKVKADDAAKTVDTLSPGSAAGDKPST